MNIKLIGPENRKLFTVVEFKDLHRAVRTGVAMIRFLQRTPGLGLAANQAGIMERVCVAKLDGRFRMFIDPHITLRLGKQISRGEGCLSFPGVRGDVVRPQRIQVRWKDVQDWQVTERTQDFQDLNAIILEHEIDHLDGIRCIDKMKNKRRIE